MSAVVLGALAHQVFVIMSGKLLLSRHTATPTAYTSLHCTALRCAACMQVCMEDFEEALKEVKPAFGAVTELLEAYRLNGIIDYGEHFRHLLSVCKQLVEQASSHPLYPGFP